MVKSIIVGLLMVLIGTAGVKAQTQNVKDAIEVIVLFCVAGGDKFEISGTGTAEGGFSLKKIGVTGKADINISKSEVRGLVDGLKQEISKLGAEQASEARSCMRPYIDRLLNLILGSSTERGSDRFGAIFIALPTYPTVVQCTVSFDIYLADQNIIPSPPLYRVANVRLGPSNWIIRGEVRCVDGAFCQSRGTSQSGNIDLRDGATYTFFWQMSQVYGQECRFSLTG